MRNCGAAIKTHREDELSLLESKAKVKRASTVTSRRFHIAFRHAVSLQRNLEHSQLMTEMCKVEHIAQIVTVISFSERCIVPLILH